MPLSEFYNMAKSKAESTPHTAASFSTDLPFIPDDEFVELVWENGQIMMQGQSSRSRRSSISNNFPPHTTRLRDKEVGSVANSKIGKLGTMESILNDIPMSVPSGEMGLSQDDDFVPWLNYPIDDTLQQDYGSELLPEFSGVTVNEPYVQNSFASIDKRGSFHQTIRDSHDVPVYNGKRSEQGSSLKISSPRIDQLYPWSSHRGQTSVPSRGYGFSDSISNNTSSVQQAVCGDSLQGQALTSSFPIMKMQKQDTVLPSRNSTLLNFSHFSRPAAIVRANLQSMGAVAGSGSSDVSKMREKNKGTIASRSNPVDAAFTDPGRGSQEEMSFHGQADLVSAKVDSKPLVTKPLEESHLAEQSDAVCREGTSKNNKPPHQIIGASTTKGVADGEKSVEPVVASSSVCSGNSAERASNDPTNNLKRKCGDTEESESQSEDVEEESVGAKKAAHARGGSSSKRSRAAEVHNLSERRRRDRINEKMRALQELIPNCNKVDKASMLDEAIEYLKTLQLQVQIMSMGSGLGMPPMMLPTGMQRIHMAHMPHFSPMGVGMGMGMGMGYGMGIMDINSGPYGCPMIPLSPLQGAPLPSPHSGPTNFQGFAGSNVQAFGHPGQGLYMSVPRAPLIPLLGQPPVNSAMGLNALRTGFHVEVANLASTSKDLMGNTNLQEMHKTDASSSMNQKCGQETKEGLDRSTLVQKSDQVPDANGGTTVDPTNANNLESSKTVGCE